MLKGNYRARFAVEDGVIRTYEHIGHDEIDMYVALFVLSLFVLLLLAVGRFKQSAASDNH